MCPSVLNVPECAQCARMCRVLAAAAGAPPAACAARRKLQRDIRGQGGEETHCILHILFKMYKEILHYSKL
eukprot:9495779-Pyramimonas_sp.AAC.1